MSGRTAPGRRVFRGRAPMPKAWMARFERTVGDNGELEWLPASWHDNLPH